MTKQTRLLVPNPKVATVNFDVFLIIFSSACVFLKSIEIVLHMRFIYTLWKFKIKDLFLVWEFKIILSVNNHCKLITSKIKYLLFLIIQMENHRIYLLYFSPMNIN